MTAEPHERKIVNAQITPKFGAFATPIQPIPSTANDIMHAFWTVTGLLPSTTNEFAMIGPKTHPRPILL